MRGYGDVVHVLHKGQVPTTFVWRGRRYRVLQVLDTWRETLPWWRLALVPDVGAGRDEDDGESRVPGPEAARYDSEQRIWRVEAASGAASIVGVFELAQHSAGWNLRKLSD